jgi:XTP/dITP diphosphohydrolase
MDLQGCLAALAELIRVVAQLRSPEGGCPWDLAQTPESLTPYIIEEAYETVDAIGSGDTAAIAEELGDLLLQVVLQAQIFAERQQFSLKEVAQGISAKLVRRHPHVFGNLAVAGVEEVRANWESIKNSEKQGEALSEKLKRYGRSLPPLLATMKISEKVAGIGFDWQDEAEIWAKFAEECQEFRQETDPQRREVEFGDMLFSLLQIARWHNIDPSRALSATNAKFARRFALMEQQAERPLANYTITELEALWQLAKQQ